MKSQNEGTKYPCDQCEYSGSQSELIQHKISIHKEIGFGNKKVLKKHQKLQHRDKPYMKTTQTAVKTTKSKYGIAVFTCDQCEFVSLDLSNLKKHKQSNHDKELGDQDGIRI